MDERRRAGVGWLEHQECSTRPGRARKAQGWTALVLDTDGNGKRDAWVEPNQPVDPTKDKRIPAASTRSCRARSTARSGASVGVFAGKGAIVRLDPGRTRRRPRWPRSITCPRRALVRAAPISTARAWSGCRSASGHLGSFDRRKCKGPLNGPNAATGDACPEGWSFHQYPGPGFAGIGKNSAEASYYTWVDQHNTLGLGKDVPISTGNENDALLALVNGKWVVMRVPYPMSFYAKGLDGRIDDPNGGWKGRGVWTTSGDRTPWLNEGGKGSEPIAFHFQIRPNPLAQ